MQNKAPLGGRDQKRHGEAWWKGAKSASSEDRTHDLGIMRHTRCNCAIEAGANLQEKVLVLSPWPDVS